WFAGADDIACPRGALAHHPGRQAAPDQAQHDQSGHEQPQPRGRCPGPQEPAQGRPGTRGELGIRGRPRRGPRPRPDLPPLTRRPMAWRPHHAPAPSPPGQLALTGPLSGTIPSLTDSTADLTRAELDNAETGWQVASAALPGRTRARRSAAGLCWVITPAPASDAAVLTLTSINSSILIHGGRKASWQSAGGGSGASTIVLPPSTDKTGAADTAAINTAMASVGPGGSVLLDPGDWYTDVPLDIPDGTELAGIK